jgi:hypothetical protein
MAGAVQAAAAREAGGLGAGSGRARAKVEM